MVGKGYVQRELVKIIKLKYWTEWEKELDNLYIKLGKQPNAEILLKEFIEEMKKYEKRFIINYDYNKWIGIKKQPVA